jgi:acyl transferase domain-containing protein
MVARHASELRALPIEPEQGTLSWQERFLDLLPRLRAHAQSRFRRLPPEAREEATAEVIASALVSYARLVAQGREDRAYATPLARYAIAQFRSGRRVGSPLNVRDVASENCRRQKGVSLERLDRFDARSGNWQEVVVEDRRSGPAEVAATKIDFAEWLAALPERTQRVAECLAAGETTAHVARMFGLSAARISQLRRELYLAWRAFQGEVVPTTASILA